MPGPEPCANHALEELELELLLEAIHRHYGHDFRHYARASLKRRLRKQMQSEGLVTLTALMERLLHDESCFERLLLTLSISVTAMFRDPSFYSTLREEVVPLLKTYPSTRIWIAGCSSGEEVYSLAILLEEEGLYDRTRIYATDKNEVVLERARAGVYPLDRMRTYTENYQRSGPRASFSEYYQADHERAVLDSGLRRHVVFSQHDLVNDGPFNEFQLILCRNVMIYFDSDLQGSVVGLFLASLCRLGFLGLGQKESLRFNPHCESFEELGSRTKLYRRIR